MSKYSIIEKINNYMPNFDYIKKVFLGNNELTVTFECQNGGSYEGIYFKLIFINPIVFKMPYALEGEFMIEQLELNNQNIIEEAWVDGFEKLFLIKHEGRCGKIELFVLCDDLDINITGRNYHIINDKELLID